MDEFFCLLVSCWHEFLLVHFFSLHCFLNFFPILKNSFTQTFQTKIIIEILLILVTTYGRDDGGRIVGVLMVTGLLK